MDIKVEQIKKLRKTFDAANKKKTVSNSRQPDGAALASDTIVPDVYLPRYWESSSPIVRPIGETNCKLPKSSSPEISPASSRSAGTRVLHDRRRNIHRRRLSPDNSSPIALRQCAPKYKAQDCIAESESIVESRSSSQEKRTKEEALVKKLLGDALIQHELIRNSKYLFSRGQPTLSGDGHRGSRWQKNGTGTTPKLVRSLARLYHRLHRGRRSCHGDQVEEIFRKPCDFRDADDPPKCQSSSRKHIRIKDTENAAKSVTSNCKDVLVKDMARLLKILLGTHSGSSSELSQAVGKVKPRQRLVDRAVETETCIGNGGGKCQGSCGGLNADLGHNGPTCAGFRAFDDAARNQNGVLRHTNSPECICSCANCQSRSYSDANAGTQPESAEKMLQLWNELANQFKGIVETVSESDRLMQEQIRKQRADLEEITRMSRECVAHYREISESVAALTSQLCPLASAGHMCCPPPAVFRPCSSSPTRVQPMPPCWLPVPPPAASHVHQTGTSKEKQKRPHSKSHCSRHGHR